jgi:hypothetical protein
MNPTSIKAKVSCMSKQAGPGFGRRACRRNEPLGELLGTTYAPIMLLLSSCLSAIDPTTETSVI